MLRINKGYNLTKIFLIIIAVLLLLNLQGKDHLKLEYPENIEYSVVTNTLNLSSLTLEQKLAQMVIIFGEDETADSFKNMFIGGVFFNGQKTPEIYERKINNYQEGAIVPFFVVADMEGCLNPFENFQNFPSFSEIETSEDAFELGKQAGLMLKHLGFNMNFAPVLDLEDKIMNCRSFPGTLEEISLKGQKFIEGLHAAGIMAVAKHYPGGTLSGADTHKDIAGATITAEDLEPFKNAMVAGVDGIMINHVIVKGAIDSKGVPSVVSPEVVGSLSGFSGFRITDEINMLGLAENYATTNVNEMFVQLVEAGNDMLLSFDRSPLHIYRMIRAIARAVDEGRIPEAQIDNSVKKILMLKGINVVE